MRTSKTFQKLIEALCAKHGRDLTAQDVHLRLENGAYMPLVIEKHGLIVSVAHYHTSNGDTCPDPDVELFAGHPEWVPIAMSSDFGYTRAVILTKDGKHIARFWRKQQADLASFCCQWGRNLCDQGWLGNGVVHA